MKLVAELKKRNIVDVCLFGEAALYACYNLPGMPIKLDYTSDTDDLRELDGRRLQPPAHKIDYKIVACKEYPAIQHLDTLDIICYSIHTKDINTMVEWMLCNLDEFDGYAIRKRYVEVYSVMHGEPGTSMADVQCVMPIETYFKNVKKSYVAEYMRRHNLSYDKFCERTPGLCAELQCSESNLNWALAQLLT